MKRLLVAVIALGILVSVFDTSRAAVPNQATVIVSATEPTVIETDPVILTAKAYSVIDIETGEILLAYNASEELPIASVTKLFTAAALLSTPEKEIVISATDVATEGRAGKLEAGQLYETHELLFPLLLESSNDAAATLERAVDEITLAGEPLADGSGLSAENRASATALAGEVRELYRTQPHIFDITRLKQYMGTYTGWVNNSPVHQLPGYRGGKHGYTQAAGRTLAAVFAEPALSDREFAYVILGSSDLKSDTLRLRAAIENSVHYQ